MAVSICGVPTATLNLIDENRQCQLTTTGFDGSDSPRVDSMCAVRFEKGEVVYRPDARLDPVYAGNPWVTGVYADVRFYLSAPLVTPRGHALGSLCVFDGLITSLLTYAQAGNAPCRFEHARLGELAELALSDLGSSAHDATVT